MQQLQIAQKQDGEVLIMSLRGKLDAITANRMRSAIDDIEKTNLVFVVLDMKEIFLVDSLGISAMVSLLRHTRSRRGDTAVAGLDQQPREIFRILSLDRTLKNFDTVDQAVHELSLKNEPIRDSQVSA